MSITLIVGMAFLLDGFRLLGSGSEGVCISFIVLGDEDIPTDDRPCDGVGSVSSSSSSSSNNSSTSSSAPGGGVISGGVAVSTPLETGDGGRRGTIERSRVRMFRLIRDYMMRRGRIPANDIATPFPSPYADVPSGSWYRQDVEALKRGGYLDQRMTLFRPNDGATRAEMAELLVRVRGGLTMIPPAAPSYDDLARRNRSFAWIEEASARGWMKGYGNCYGTSSRPCLVKGAEPISRAEAAAMIVRAFDLKRTTDAPLFYDLEEGAWYVRVIQAAADGCVARGDGAGAVRPNDTITRAEMAVMTRHAMLKLRYGVDCRWESRVPGILGRLWPADRARVGTSSTNTSPALILAPQPITLTEPPMCLGSLPHCLWRSAAEDFTSLARGLLASLHFPDRALLRSVHPSEPMLWTMILLLLATSLHAMHAWTRHRRTGAQSVAKHHADAPEEL
jgi:hypothetical protein